MSGFNLLENKLSQEKITSTHYKLVGGRPSPRTHMAPAKSMLQSRSPVLAKTNTQAIQILDQLDKAGHILLLRESITKTRRCTFYFL